VYLNFRYRRYTDSSKVSFSYPSRRDELALDNVSFFLPAGETTFVVGRSGSGKSTLGNLLMRFYNPTSGHILIDDTPIQTLDMNWLRNNVTLVQQQNVLFNETLFKNIAFGHRDHGRVRKEELKTCIELAWLQQTISDLPRGLNTLLGNGGNTMSGGQKQRVAIARACLRDTPILILDEATSALDHVTKTLVFKAIRDWRRGKTTIIITHDMSQIQDDDYAYVLDKGAIVQEGFKHTLDKTAIGPFTAPPRPSVYYPPTTQLRVSAARRHESLISDSHSLSTLSDVSHDSMEILIQPRKTFVPSVFSPRTEESGSPQASRGFLSPMSPVPFPLHRTSYAPSVYCAPQRRTSEIFELLDIQRLTKSQSPVGHQAQKIVSKAREGNKPDNSEEKIERHNKLSLHTRTSSTLSTTTEGFARIKRRSAKSERAHKIAPLKAILLTVWPCLKWEKHLILILGFFCAAVHAAATPVFSWVFSNLLSTFFLADRNERSHMAFVWSMLVLGVAATDSIASYAMHYLLERCGQAWIDALRIEALKRVLDQPLAWFDQDKNNVTKLTECLDRNAEEMRNLLGRFAGFVFVALVMVTIALVWSMIISWKLTLVGLASAPFMYAVTRTFEHVSGKWEGKSNYAGEQANAIFTETFANIRTVRALTLEGYFHKKYTESTSKAFRVGLKRSAFSGIFFGISDSGIVFVTALIFWYGAHLASTHANSTTDILTIFTMLLFSIANANAIIAFVPQINSSRSTATRLLRLAYLPYHTSHEHTGNIRLFSPGPITFTNTSFTYPTRPTAPVLDSLNLNIQPGTATALVGASGSGKSTIASLLLALHTPNCGSITLNDVSIKELHTSTLRSLVSIVPQAPTLFPASVAKNIAYTLPENSPLASTASIFAAAKAAGIDTFIFSLPNGYETLLGPGGTELSGGQAQRIAIARAVLRRPKLLILDEVTSALDGESAAMVRDMVRGMGKRGCGVLVITHSEFMMRGCEEVVVLKDGRVVERGGMGELMRRQGGELRRLLGEGRDDDGEPE